MATGKDIDSHSVHCVHNPHFGGIIQHGGHRGFRIGPGQQTHRRSAFGAVDSHNGHVTANRQCAGVVRDGAGIGWCDTHTVVTRSDLFQGGIGSEGNTCQCWHLGQLCVRSRHVDIHTINNSGAVYDGHIRYIVIAEFGVVHHLEFQLGDIIGGDDRVGAVFIQIHALTQHFLSVHQQGQLPGARRYGQVARALLEGNTG